MMDRYDEHWVRSTAKRLFSKESVCTLPNLLTGVRLLLVPVILWLGLKKNDLHAVLWVFLFAGITDVADGQIARRSGAVSDLGKIFDPLADKLTQVSVLICLMKKFTWLKWLMMVFVAKEIIQFAIATLAIRTSGQVINAKWFGKVSTVVFYAVITLLLVFPDMPVGLAKCLAGGSGAMLLLSLIMYGRIFVPVFRPRKENGESGER